MTKKRYNKIKRLRNQRNKIEGEIIKLEDKIDRINKKLFKLLVK